MTLNLYYFAAWKKLRTLDLARSKYHPQCMMIKNVLCSDPSNVSGKWKSEFEKLYSIKNVEYNESYQNMLYQKYLLQKSQ